VPSYDIQVQCEDLAGLGNLLISSEITDEGPGWVKVKWYVGSSLTQYELQCRFSKRTGWPSEGWFIEPYGATWSGWHIPYLVCEARWPLAEAPDPLSVDRVPTAWSEEWDKSFDKSSDPYGDLLSEIG